MRRPVSQPKASVKRSLRASQETLERLRLDPAVFADTFLPYNEKGKPRQLNPHQRRVLARAFRRAPGGGPAVPPCAMERTEEVREDVPRSRARPRVGLQQS